MAQGSSIPSRVWVYMSLPNFKFSCISKRKKACKHEMPDLLRSTRRSTASCFDPWNRDERIFLLLIPKKGLNGCSLLSGKMKLDNITTACTKPNSSEYTSRSWCFPHPCQQSFQYDYETKPWISAKKVSTRTWYWICASVWRPTNHNNNCTEGFAAEMNSRGSPRPQTSP